MNIIKACRAQLALRSLSAHEATLNAYVQHSRAFLCLVIYPIESWVHIDHHEHH